MAQCNGGLECVADLSTVPRHALPVTFFEMPFGELKEGVAIEDDFHVGGLVVSFEAVENISPLFLCRVEADSRIAEGDMDARFEGFVDDAWTVGGEEEDSGVVF